MDTIDRKAIAQRIFRLNRWLGIGTLARSLGTTIATLDKIVCYQGGRDATYRKVLPALERLEADALAVRWRALLEARQRRGEAGVRDALASERASGKLYVGAHRRRGAA